MRNVDLDVVKELYKKPGAARLDVDQPARFQVDDEVRARNINPPGHTRLPRYCRGKRGVVARCNGVFHLADARAHGADEGPQHNYSIRAGRQVNDVELPTSIQSPLMSLLGECCLRPLGESDSLND